MIEVAVYDTKPYDREYFGPKAGDKKIRWRFHEFRLSTEIAETARVTAENILKLESGGPFLQGTTL